MTKESIMRDLNISTDDLSLNEALVIEKLFCCAILNDAGSIDIIVKILDHFRKMRGVLYPGTLSSEALVDAACLIAEKSQTLK